MNSEAERQRVILCLEAAIRRRASEVFESLEGICRNPCKSRAARPTDPMISIQSQYRSFARPVTNLECSGAKFPYNYKNSFTNFFGPCVKVYLYNWFLISVDKNCPENGIIDDRVQVAVGGYTTSDLLDSEKFRTAPIESRIERCKLRTVDGLDVLLMGTIDDQCSYDNGFPFQVIHLFMHGFPFNWSHLVNICKGRPSSNVGPLLASKMEEYASKECPVVQVDDTGTGKLSSLESEGNFSKVISPRESSVRCSKRVRHEAQPSRSSKGSKRGKLSTESKPQRHFRFVGSQDNFNILQESEANLCSSNKSIEKEGAIPHLRSSDMDIHLQINQEDKLTVLGGELGRTKPLNFSVSHIVKEPVENEKKIMKGYCLQRAKRSEEFKKQIDGRTSLDEEKFLKAAMKIEDTNENNISCRFTDSEGDAHHRLDNWEVELSLPTNEHLEKSSDNCNPLEERTQGIQIPISEFAMSGYKMRRGIVSGKSNTKKNKGNRNAFSQASRDLFCDDATVKDGIKGTSEGKYTTHSEESHQEIIHTKPLHEVCKVNSQFSLDSNFLEFGSKKHSTGTDGRAQAEEDNLIDVGFVQLQKNVSFHSAQTKPFSPGNSYINTDVIRSEKNVNKSETRRQGRGTRRTTTRHTNPSPAVLEGLMCSEKMVKDDVNLKFDDIDATSNGDPNLVACEIDNGMLAEHDIEIGDDCLKENVDRDKGNLQTKPFSPGNSRINNDVIGSEKNVNKSKTKRQGRGTGRTTTRHTNPSPAVLEGFMCSEKMVKDDVNLKFDDIDATSNGNPNLVACEIDNGMLAEHDIEIGDDCLKENVDRGKGSLQTKPFSPGNSHINNDVIRSEKNVNKSETKRQGRGTRRTITRHTNPSPAVLEGLMCSEKMVKDDVNLKFDDIDATSNVDPNLVACEIDNRMLAEHDIEIGDDCLKENVDRDKGSLQTKPFSPGNSHINNVVIRSEKNVNKSKTKRQGRGTGRTTTRHTNPSPAVLEGLMCSEKMVKNDVNLKFDDIDATSNGDPNLVACEIDNGMLAEHDIEIGDDCLMENVDRDKGSLQTKPFSPGNSHINNDVIRSEKNVNKSKIKRQGRGTRRTTTRHTNPSPAVLEGLMCSEKMMKDDVNLKFDNIDATSNGDPNLVACGIDNGMLAEHGIEIGDDCLKENVDRDKGSLQTPKHGTLRTTGTPIGKRQYSHTRIPPALPRRVQITPDEVSKAFGLKTSRSGRLLVPPLAHWCNQTIAYDLDGGIIAIFDGISEDKKHNGGHTFRPPTEAEAIKMQRKLCKAANEVIKTPKSGKKMSKD